tara:strand:- start:318 stop:923 length:606 start_codon:yes stop_codon:yes gene_type:complete
MYNAIRKLSLISLCVFSFGLLAEDANAQDGGGGTDEPVTPAIEPIITESTVTTNGNTTTTLKSPPASAISPTINTSNSDLCTFGVAGAIQTQILGISTGTQVTDDNCERLKNSKTLFDMGMKVAAVSLMCQDPRVFDAMMNAGTPCPFDGLIGEEAKAAWSVNTDDLPVEDEDKKKEPMSDQNKTLLGGAGIASLLVLLLL